MTERPIPRAATLRHVCSATEHGAAEPAGGLRPGSLAAVGFVHLCTPEQLPGVLARFYAGAVGLVVLHVDPGRLPPGTLVWEEGEPGEDFPHLYAPLPLDAVVAVEAR